MEQNYHGTELPWNISITMQTCFHGNFSTTFTMGIYRSCFYHNFKPRKIKAQDSNVMEDKSHRKNCHGTKMPCNKNAMEQTYHGRNVMKERTAMEQKCNGKKKPRKEK